MNIIFASYGNDSIALIQRLADKGVPGIVAHNDTGWSSPEWADRVARGEAFARSLGFETKRLASVGMEALARQKKGWPSNQFQFCTVELKVKPALAWMREIDPDCEGTCYVGVRREESKRRATWPEWVEVSMRHGGRSLCSPLVRMTTLERDELVVRAGFEVLPHRSMECYPCVNANKADIRFLTEARVAEIEAIERDLGVTANGKPRTFFRPHRTGGEVGVRAAVEWANGKRKLPLADETMMGEGAGCDSGMCGES